MLIVLMVPHSILWQSHLEAYSPGLESTEMLLWLPARWVSSENKASGTKTSLGGLSHPNFHQNLTKDKKLEIVAVASGKLT